RPGLPPGVRHRRPRLPHRPAGGRGLFGARGAAVASARRQRRRLERARDAPRRRAPPPARRLDRLRGRLDPRGGPGMSPTPRAGGIADTHNYGRSLPQAIDSALAQTYPRTEVIVVDDGSTDGSREIIAAYGDRVRPVLKANGGQASAFNAGF